MGSDVMKVVIADESESSRWALAHRLELDPQDFEIALHDSLADLTAHLEAHDPDAVLVSSAVVEPRQLRAICEQNSSTTFLVCVDEVTASVIERYVSHGADDVVGRVQSAPQDLMRAINYGVHRRRAERARNRAQKRERALVEHQHRLLDVLDEIDALVGTSDATGAISYMNSAARSFWLRDGANHADMNLVDLVVEGEQTRLLTTVFPQLVADLRWTGSVQLLAASGETVPSDVTMLAHRDEHGHAFYSAIGRVRP